MDKKEKIKNDLITFLKKGNPLIEKIVNLPMNESLVEKGFVDSFGIIEIITYFEKKYKITIDDKEITKEKFGSINKMVGIVFNKIKKSG
jgi:acyl carrier protein